MAESKILIAEDDEDDYFFIKEAFDELVKYDLMRVSDGKLLVDHLKKQEALHFEFPDLILLDINMPRMDGIKALELIKSSDALSKIPVIIYSTANYYEQRKQCYILGANGFVTKGYSQKDVMSFVGSVCKFMKILKTAPMSRFVHKSQPINLKK